MPKRHDDCLFCAIAREGAYVNQSKGFVAINDINPQAPVHVLVIPERHVDTFREIVKSTGLYWMVINQRPLSNPVRAAKAATQP